MATVTNIATIRTAAALLKRHAQDADLNRDGILTKTEIRRYAAQQQDGFSVGNALLTMQNWALRDLERANSAGVPHVQQKVDDAMEIIERKDLNGDGELSTGKELNSVKRLKTFQALSSLVPQAGFEVPRTEQAVAAVAIPELTDFATTLTLARFPATDSRTKVIRTITQMGELNAKSIATYFKRAEGQEAQTQFSAAMVSVGTEKGNNADDEATGARISRLFGAVSEAIQQEFQPGQFKRLETLSHRIAEDGETEHRILLAQLADSSWLAVTYRDFPF